MKMKKINILFILLLPLLSGCSTNSLNVNKTELEFNSENWEPVNKNHIKKGF